MRSLGAALRPLTPENPLSNHNVNTNINNGNTNTTALTHLLNQPAITMSASKLSHVPGRRPGNIFIYIDNSNLWIQGQRTYAEKNNLNVSWDPTWRFDVGCLRDILLKKSGLKEDEQTFDVKVNLYGSTPPPLDTVWTAIASHNVKVNTFKRSSWTRREKQVDAELIADSIEQACEARLNKIPAVFIIVSGDRDLRSAITRITKKRGFQVHLWSWKNGLAGAYTKDDEDIAQHLFEVHLLDNYLDEVGFRVSEFRVDRAMISPHSIVVLDPLPEADKVEAFLKRLGTPVYRYEIKPKREGAASLDLAIIPAFAPSMSDDHLRELFMESQSKLQSKDLTVLTYLEYSQKYGAGGRANNALTISGRFKELSPLETESARCEADDSDSDDGDHDSKHKAGTEEEEEEQTKPDDGFTKVNQRSEKQRARMRRNEEHSHTRCVWGRYCSRGLDCTYGHTKEEESHFQVYRSLKPKKYKYCNKDGCTRGKGCLFAHGAGEIFCPTCEKTGKHEMADCPERFPSAGKSYN